MTWKINDLFNEHNAHFRSIITILKSARFQMIDIITSKHGVNDNDTKQFNILIIFKIKIINYEL